jgi:hypothetical protein
MRDARSALQEPRQLSARSRDREALECRAAGEHHADDGSREIFAEGECAHHRQDRDEVDTQFSSQ